MDATQKACCDALEFFFQQIGSIGLAEKRILILQGFPSSYVKHLKNAHIDTLTYCAKTHSGWLQQNITPITSPSGDYDIVIQFASKSESETALHLALGLDQLKPEGQFIGVVHNRMGSTRYRKNFEKLFKQVDTLSKSKARVCSANKKDLTQSPNYTFPPEPQLIANSDYKTLPGVYGERAIDTGSVLLAEILKKEHWSGIGADIGCGYGYLSGEILSTKHRVKQLWLYDIDSRAIAMSKLNLAPFPALHCHWVDVCKEVPVERAVHWVVMNPPFHSGSTQDFELGKKFIQQAASILRQGSPLFIVANQHLPYEEELHANFRSVVKLVEKEGFKCYRAVK